MKLRFLILILLLSLSISGGYAKDVFYNGNITLDSLVATIDITENAQIDALYTLKNSGPVTERVVPVYSSPSIPIMFQGQRLSQPLTIPAGEERQISVNNVQEVQGENTKVFSYDPSLLFNDQELSTITRSADIIIILPTGTQQLISTNVPPESQTMTPDGRVIYHWLLRDRFLVPLSLKWSGLDVVLEVTKTIRPMKISESSRDITIEISLMNKGNTPVENIWLIDDFDPSQFNELEPRGEFTDPSSEPRILWRKNITVMQPNEMRTFRYSVRFIDSIAESYDIVIRPTRVYMSRDLVGASNEVTINMVNKTDTSQDSGRLLPLHPILSVIALGILTVTLSMRRKFP
jgi:hypothetical protein